MTLPLEPFPHRISRDVPITPIDKRETAVYAFDKDSPAGDITWETEQPATEQINQAIRNVLVRKPARFFDVTVQQAEKEDKEAEKKRVEEEQDSSLLKTQDLSESEGTAKTAQEAVEVAVKMMTVEEMGQMKVELHQTLGVAWNELNKIAELCRSLITTQPHPYVLPPNEATASIPAKSLSGTLADRAPPTQAVRLLGDTKLAVVQHIDSIKRSQDILVDGSKQLMSLREQEDVYWRNVLRVRGIGGGNGQDDSQGPGDKKKVAETGDSLSWSLLPRPLSNGLPPHRQMATDVMIPYAPDEGKSVHPMHFTLSRYVS
ncbi:hypothetical protein QFC22_000717 [Naganishia vaughanmartiniae]|uniref:Uncharacterized protein n=1 Tax=Naganishia vaughanmartiniae TaxID=1424756 RepID=A0ACC2XLL7_9TREE|nr:hypothetical protein QFC22_000717 [Naganishia vaughanmartiniae]